MTSEDRQRYCIRTVYQFLMTELDSTEERLAILVRIERMIKELTKPEKKS